MSLAQASMKIRAPNNRTIVLNEDDRRQYQRELIEVHAPVALEQIRQRVICQDMQEVIGHLPGGFVDLLFLDPPYNLAKQFGEETFKALSGDAYRQWYMAWFVPLLRLLKPSASVYVCADWRSSGVVQAILQDHLVVRNRITWEREKGRGAKANWKNCAEDIWYCTVSDRYYFNLDAVKLKRRVRAPYTDLSGHPKDWTSSEAGDFRLTHPSNLWTDLTVPYWSMTENTEHPAQKPEKLVAKVLLASTEPGDFVFDPFLGSGTTAVVAEKLGRDFCGIERESAYCLLAQKRLALAKTDQSIQGYEDGVFWERNSAPNRPAKLSSPQTQQGLFLSDEQVIE